MLANTARLLPFLLVLSSVACEGVKQQQPPRIPDEGEGEGLSEGSGDITAPEKDTIEVSEGGEEETPEQQRAKCCQQCVDGLADDKSGDPPGAIPCTKLNTKMEARCVVWFDKNPMTGGEAQKCVEDSSGGEEGGEDEAPSID